MLTAASRKSVFNGCNHNKVDRQQQARCISFRRALTSHILTPVASKAKREPDSVATIMVSEVDRISGKNQRTSGDRSIGLQTRPGILAVRRAQANKYFR